MSALGTSEESKDLVPYYAREVGDGAGRPGRRHPVRDLPAELRLRARRRDPPDLLQARALRARDADHRLGRAQIQPIWAGDVGAYFDKAIDLEAATNRTFELGGPDVVTWNEFWERLKKARGIRRPSVHVPVGLHEGERAPHGAAPRRHPAHARPAEDARARATTSSRTTTPCRRSSSRSCRSTSSCGAPPDGRAADRRARRARRRRRLAGRLIRFVPQPHREGASARLPRAHGQPRASRVHQSASTRT